MAIKIMLDVKGELFDMWEFRSVQRSQRYDDVKQDMVYQILINKNAIATNYNDLVLEFDTLEEREDIMTKIKQKFDDSDTVVIL